MNAFQKSPQALLEQLGSDRDRGLTARQADENRARYGANAFTREKPVSMGRRILDALREPMLILLLFAAVVTLGVNVAHYITSGTADFVECVGIFVAISLSVIITVVMEGRSAKAFEALSRIGDDTKVRVVRDGGAQQISQQDVVVGDILLVGTGDKLPADGRLLEGNALQADESALTGESMPVQKDAGAVLENERTPVAERVNMLYSGCFVTGGSGKMLVTAVGDETEFGKIARELSSTESTSTPLQEKLAKLGKRITILGASAAGLVFVLQAARFWMQGAASWDNIAEAFISSIVLIVASVPEGLPTIVAVSLAVNIIKMSKQNALVKKMVACETVGCINVICSDKTGTLTENRMTVTDIYSDGALCKPQALRSARLLENFCVNGTADLRFENGKPQFIGNPTECALLLAASCAGQDYRALREQAEVAHVFPFSSETKYMTTLLRSADGLTVYAKGSPEKILSLCNLEQDRRAAAEREILRFQENASRVIGFAHGSGAVREDFESHRDELEHGLIFDGFVAISDPLRPEVYDAVAHCRDAGIDLKMLTGDNLITARAIAGELGILDETHVAVEARELDALSEEELADRLGSIRVIARSTPIIKMRVVNALKARGNVVAVTGDGINDAPAIKNADVGVAMGIAGTEVSKEASDIVLLDDSFATIVRAVQWGRGIYENFQRFIQFQLTVNLSSVLVVLTSILAGFQAPFTALQLLWINIIMDGPPAVTLGLEPIRGDLMKRSPTRRDASIITYDMLWRIVVNGVYLSIIFMAQHWGNFLGGTPEQSSTILFTLFVVFQLFNAFNSRELSDESVFRNFGSNRLMLGVFAATFALQVIITQFGGAMFGTVPLPLSMWVKIVLTGFTVVLASELAKFARRTIFRAR